MNRMPLILILVASLGFMSCQSISMLSGAPPSDVNRAPVHVVGSGDDFVCDWLLVGPFPKPAEGEVMTGNEPLIGYGKDYLAEVGGETNAVITSTTQVSFLDEAGAPQTAKTMRSKARPDHITSFFDHYIGMKGEAAYAFAYLWSERDLDYHGFLGAGDSSQVWINGERLHSDWNGFGRHCIGRTFNFPIHLNKGLNRVLIKNENHGNNWGYVFELMAPDKAAEIVAQQERSQAVKDFQDVAIRPEGRWDYMFEVGGFPKLHWENPDKVKSVFGEFPLNIRWFDAGFNEVATPEKPGRYAAYIEGKTSNGMTVRRAQTFYCRNQNWHPWEENWVAYLQPLAADGPINPEALVEQREQIGSAVGNWFFEFLSTEPSGARLMAHLAESKPLGREPVQLDGPDIRDQDYHLALKRKILGVENKYPGLALPHKKDGAPAIVLRTGAPEEAGMKSDSAARIHDACEQWYKATGDPMTVLVARRGVVVIHEAVGSTTERPTDVNTQFPLASLTKSLSGMLFAQFLDQGLIGLDDPVGTYLPDFPTTGGKAVTLHHCLTMTTGLDVESEWCNMNNPWLDNVIANGVENLRPGKVWIYNGTSFDLAGKVMEIVSGKSIFRLFHENFFGPLGMSGQTSIVAMSYGTMCTVEDLAKIGQLLCNRGSYGKLEFFSPQTFELLMDHPLEEAFPEIENRGFAYGLGIGHMPQRHPDAGKGDIPDDRMILSPNIIGHGAGSGTILLVDLDNELVIALSRSQMGPDFSEHTARFLLAVDESLVK